MARILSLVMSLLAALAPATAATERFYVVGSVIQAQRSTEDADAVVTHTARVFLGDRQTDALILCAGSLAYGRNENVLHSQLACSVLQRQGASAAAGSYTHHALSLDAVEAGRPRVDAFVTVAQDARMLRFCIVLSRLELACVETAIPVPEIGAGGP